MRRVAGALRSGTALYRCIDGREELLDLMVDAVLGDDPHPPPSGHWRADLAALAQQLRVLLRRHPWVRPQMAGRPTLGPHVLGHYEFALTATTSLTADATAAVRRGRHGPGVRARSDREGDGRDRDAASNWRDRAGMARPGRAVRTADPPKWSISAVRQGRPRGGRPRRRAAMRVWTRVRPRRHCLPSCRPAALLGASSTLDRGAGFACADPRRTAVFAAGRRAERRHVVQPGARSVRVAG
jgi:hypothetical protein